MLSNAFYLQNGIRTQRLPINEYISMNGRQVLTINHVGEILIDIVNGKSWKSTLLSVIPQRKVPTSLEDEELEEPEESEEPYVCKDICKVV
jgi:tRNA (guanine9-N1)-methyltransferase